MKVDEHRFNKLMRAAGKALDRDMLVDLVHKVPNAKIVRTIKKYDPKAGKEREYLIWKWYDYQNRKTYTMRDAEMLCESI